MLKGLKILEFQGLAPSVFCGMYFADQGADVIVVARPQPVPFSMEIHKNIMNRNKRCIKLSLKNQSDRTVLIQLIKNVDIIIDPFRPGVLQKQKFGPSDLHSINPKIILLRVSGYGQTGDMALRPGHDLNYISTSGILKLINQGSSKLQFPANYLADFVSASLGIFGTLKALSSRRFSNQGSVVDCSLTGGCSYLTSLVREDKILKSEAKNYTIKYVEFNEKRYLITEYGHGRKILETEINSSIEQMERKNQVFFKNDSYEIAQIKKISKIKDSALGNPFEQSNMNKVSNRIPKRDENREQILRDYKVINAKL